ncbi:hypothetical protein ASAC_0928 [Acidilobus saccharovorans 345-15]|uniref:Uncharacterized protein n=1 Tax=Acidilobus saccharovorans (strain DSM 16705 / JCM 18335 / VKM B-2471 / 345-15) TaxID=666510 RepID=D9Q1Z6_ACIS3|nr:hypothetical protein ASAC_0928 [Acidilobus saccharovorans 345-15]
MRTLACPEVMRITNPRPDAAHKVKSTYMAVLHSTIIMIIN